MNRLEEAHSTCLNVLHDHKDSAPRIAELCRFTRQLGGEIDKLRTKLDRIKAILKREDISFGAMSEINAIMEEE